MKKLGVSRRAPFEQLERPALKPLSSERFEMGQWKRCGVNIDYHIEIERNYYSVPHPHLDEEVEARFTPAVVEVYFKGRRVASHRRLYGRGRCSTDPAHMPRAHSLKPSPPSLTSPLYSVQVAVDLASASATA